MERRHIQYPIDTYYTRLLKFCLLGNVAIGIHIGLLGDNDFEEFPVMSMSNAYILWFP